VEEVETGHIPDTQIPDTHIPNTQIEDRFVAVDGAGMMHLQVAGTGNPLLLLHGLIGSTQTWRQNISFLAREATVYAIDLFNMGKSERVPGLDAGLEATADRIAALMDALHLPEADIAAHSHGGAIAMMLAARHPHRVRRLILFAPANPFCKSRRLVIRFFQTRLGTWLAHRVPSLPRHIQAKALYRMYGDRSRVAEGTLEVYTAGLEIPGTMDHILEILRCWFDDMQQLRSALGRLAAMPTLLIWGDRDRAVNLSSALGLQRTLAQSRLLVIEGAGHLPFEEMPEACNLAMRDWLVGAQTRSNATLTTEPA
jgi:4,5:9,10-diseco-3-hydroxy-5,9,17-trioxoandrosta-1(10),2-diene-4-oate hydrolase